MIALKTYFLQFKLYHAISYSVYLFWEGTGDVFFEVLVDHIVYNESCRVC